MKILTRKCKACNEDKLAIDYINGRNECKECRCKYQKEYRNKNPLVKWAQENKSSQRLERERFLSGRKLQPM